MWATELTGNRIARVTAEGRLVEYDLLTPNSRPIAIVPGPDGAMWFSEEAGNEVGRIDSDGIFTTFILPELPGRPNLLLAGLAFDGSGDLWVQQYADPKRPGPAGEDYLLRLDRDALKGPPQGFKPGQFERIAVPTRQTVMHRVIQGPDKAMWFTEMHSDKVGRLAVR